jgi:uncharacterized C2H2 Zn-finger protein
MRLIRVEKWCDACHDEGGHTEATVTVGLVLSPSVKPLTLDLCDKHNDSLIEPVRALLISHGAAPEANGEPGQPVARKPEGRVQCPQCQIDFANRRVVIEHLQTKHGYDRIEASKVAPVTKKAVECPICGYVSDGDQGLAVHTKHQHDENAVETTGVGVCPSCHADHGTKHALKIHTVADHNASLEALLHPDRALVCDICQYRASAPQGLASHIRKTHGESGS